MTAVIGWTISLTATLAGKLVEAGTEVHVPWEGRFRFLRHVTNAAGAEWVDLFGGKAGHETIRSFRPDRISKVYKTKLIKHKQV